MSVCAYFMQITSYLSFFVSLSRPLQVATDKDNGILLYKEDRDPLALELYQGHIRLIYDISNYPPTTVYRSAHVYTRTKSSHIPLRFTHKHIKVKYGNSYPKNTHVHDIQYSRIFLKRSQLSSKNTACQSTNPSNSSLYSSVLLD